MLTPENTEAIRRIEEAIGYTFHDKRLLVQVLTRKTYLKIDPEAPDNEVLEFYGDTLMNYHVTNYFMSKYAHMLDDGLFFMRTVEQFTDMRSHYVCNRYLTDRIKAMGLARYLRAQNRDSELRRDGEKAYADIFESLVGAIYLDSYQNDNLIRAFILRQLGIEPKRPPEEIEAFNYDSLACGIPTEVADPEATLPLPDEETEKATEIPAPVRPPVTVAEAPEETPEEMSVAQPAEAPDPKAEAVTKPADEAVTPTVNEVVPAAADETVPAVEEAAPPILPVEPVPTAEPTEALPMPMQEALADFCRRRGFDQPTYGETPKNAPNARPVAACTLKYKDAKGKTVKISLNDSGRTLAEATEKAAAKMLKKLADQVTEGTKKGASPAREAVVTEKVAEPAPVAESAPVTEIAEAVTVAVSEPVVEAPAEPVVETLEATAEEPAVEIETEAVTETEAEAEIQSLPAVAVETSPDVEQLVIEVAETLPPEEDRVETAAEIVIEGTEAAPADPAPVETADESAPAEKPKPNRAPRKKKAETAEGEKPARKTTTRKKAASKEAASKEADSKEAAPAEQVTETSANETGTAPVAEAAAEASAVAEAPVKTTKPRTRKPRAPKAAAVAPAETSEAVASEEKSATAEE